MKGVPGRAFLTDPQKLNPYTYCRNNPITRVDLNGLWDINIQLSQNRDNTGWLILNDNRGKEVARYETKGRGSNLPVNNNNHKNRMMSRADSPTGIYSITNVGDKVKPASSYGPNGVIKLAAGHGEAINAWRRSGIWIHGGDLLANGNLRPTWGCFRLSNENMADLLGNINLLETIFTDEVPGYVYVNDVDNSGQGNNAQTTGTTTNEESTSSTTTTNGNPSYWLLQYGIGK